MSHLDQINSKGLGFGEGLGIYSAGACGFALCDSYSVYYANIFGDLNGFVCNGTGDGRGEGDGSGNGDGCSRGSGFGDGKGIG